MAKQRQVRFALVMDKKMKDRLLEIADRDNISAADYVREAIQEKFDENKGKFTWHSKK